MSSRRTFYAVATATSFLGPHSQGSRATVAFRSHGMSRFWLLAHATVLCVCCAVVRTSVLHVLPIYFRRCYISPTTDKGCPYMTEVFSGVLWQWVTCSDTGSFYKYH
jgi:hypothetical protein